MANPNYIHQPVGEPLFGLTDTEFDVIHTQVNIKPGSPETKEPVINLAGDTNLLAVTFESGKLTVRQEERSPSRPPSNASYLNPMAILELPADYNKINAHHIRTFNGDVNLRNINAATSLTVVTDTGSIALRGANVEAAGFTTNWGDAEIHGLAASGPVALATKWGKIDVFDSSAEKFEYELSDKITLHNVTEG